jgi:hypothetical protein
MIPMEPGGTENWVHPAKNAVPPRRRRIKKTIKNFFIHPGGFKIRQRYNSETVTLIKAAVSP